MTGVSIVKEEFEGHHVRFLFLGFFLSLSSVSFFFFVVAFFSRVWNNQFTIQVDCEDRPFYLALESSPQLFDWVQILRAIKSRLVDGKVLVWKKKRRVFSQEQKKSRAEFERLRVRALLSFSAVRVVSWFFEAVNLANRS